jgi:hypothetical protein
MNSKNKLNYNNSSELLALLVCEGFRRIKIFLIIALSALAVACASRPPVQVGDISNNMEVSISPDGTRLFLYWRDKDQPSQVRARLLKIVDNKTEFLSDLELPSDVSSTAYGYSNNEVLVTTYKDGIGKLWKINVATQEKTLVTESKYRFSFPAEPKPGRYVFLERNGVNNFAFWQRFENGRKIQINDFPFRAATELNILNDGLIIYTPGNAFMLIDEKWTKMPKDVYKGSPFFIKCTQLNEVVCHKSYLGKFEKYYPSTEELISDSKHCTVPGTWRDTRGTSLSRSGEVLVFHAVKNHDNLERGLYFVRFNEDVCFVSEISINGV